MTAQHPLISRLASKNLTQAMCSIYRRHRWAVLVFALLLNAATVVRMWGHIDSLDFAAFYASGEAALHGHSPYGAASPTGLPNMNPPALLPLFVLAAKIKPEVGLYVLQMTSLLIYILCIRYITKGQTNTSNLRTLWLVSVQCVWYTISLGQIYILLLPLVLSASHCIERDRWGAAGLSLGAMVACKPNFAVWPAALLLAGYWKAAMVAGLTAMVLGAIPILGFGPGIYADWLTVIEDYSILKAHCTNISLQGIAANLGIPALGEILSIAILVGLALWAGIRHPDAQRIATPALAVSILAAPLGWVSYSIFLLPAMAIRDWSWRLRTTAAILLIPFIFNPLLCRWPLLADLVLVTPLIMILWDSLVHDSRNDNGLGTIG